MTLAGERDPYAAGPQPGDRRPAPGELALLQAFLNTHFDLASGGGESLDSPEALRAWLGERGLLRDAALTPPDVARAVSIREGLRALALANNDEALDAGAVDAMRAASRGATAEIRAEPDGAHFVMPERCDLDAALGALLAVAARAMIDGSWPRLKACPGRDCGWVFYDRSRNQSARWCAMKVCGDREKARAYYERRTSDQD